jgi:lysophospholipase L1-like esterase
MKRVTLIGDSIRIGYQDIVRSALAGEAEVAWPEENAGNSRNVLQHLDEWVLSQSQDVVHINFGLHDLRRGFDAPDCVVPLDEYRRNVEQVLATIGERTDARVFWATTTPVNQAWHHATKGFDRLDADVERYNAAALEACEKLDVPVDDLNAVVTAAGKDTILVPDGVHYGPEGCRLLGEAVAGFLRGVL